MQLPSLSQQPLVFPSNQDFVFSSFAVAHRSPPILLSLESLNPQKTRIVHVRHGFEFLGYKIKRGGRPMRLPTSKIRTREIACYRMLKSWAKR